VGPTDPATYAAVAGTIALVTMVASFVPARRAASVDPMQALRID
jgi:putative ABC transport system permease protein